MPRNGLAAGSAAPSSTQTGVGGALGRFSRRSYAVDYVALACLVVGWILVSGQLSWRMRLTRLTVCCWHCIQIQKLAHPFHRMFTLDNRAIQYPFAVTERVSVS